MSQAPELPFFGVGELYRKQIDLSSYEHLIELERSLEPTISVDDTIRVKLLDRCGMTCTFCHNEGTPVKSKTGFQALRVSIYADSNGIPFVQEDINSGDIDSFQQGLAQLKNSGMASELHWTGGEPTLSKDLPVLTAAAKEVGYSVKMTSNGQTGDRRMAELAAAGLDAVNISVFGTTPEELASTQGEAFSNNLALAQLRLDMMSKAMDGALAAGLNVKANIVISGHQDIERGLRLLEATSPEVKVRFQADTSSRDESKAAIYELMTRLEGLPVARELVAGCSIDNYDYELPNGRRVTFKQTRFSRLPETCLDCPVDTQGDCYEGYYGLRLYKDGLGKYWISPCIQKMDTSQELEQFLAPGGLAQEVKAYRDNDLISLVG